MRQQIPIELDEYAAGVKGISLQDRVTVLERALTDVLARLSVLEPTEGTPLIEKRKQLL